jgi:uncharacterized protein YcfJ
MKKLLITTAILVASATSAMATEYARITKIEPRYQTSYQNVPRTSCQDVEVPVYGNRGGGATGGDVLGGMIIGGLLGKGVTGKDNGAAAGAVLGGIIAAENNNGRRVVTGYRVERQCTEVMMREETSSVKDYRITFEWNGIYGSAYTYNNYSLGQRIPVEVSLRAK